MHAKYRHAYVMKPAHNEASRARGGWTPAQNEAWVTRIKKENAINLHPDQLQKMQQAEQNDFQPLELSNTSKFMHVPWADTEDVPRHIAPACATTHDTADAIFGGTRQQGWKHAYKTERKDRRGHGGRIGFTRNSLGGFWTDHSFTVHQHAPKYKSSSRPGSATARSMSMRDLHKGRQTKSRMAAADLKQLQRAVTKASRGKQLSKISNVERHSGAEEHARLKREKYELRTRPNPKSNAWVHPRAAMLADYPHHADSNPSTPARRSQRSKTRGSQTARVHKSSRRVATPGSRVATPRTQRFQRY